MWPSFGGGYVLTIRITPKVIAACYEFIRHTEPFCQWKLPSAKRIKFTVNRQKAEFGFHLTDGKDHEIQISNRTVGHCMTLIETVAHEAIHVRQTQLGHKTGHGKDFKRMARQVCRLHGYDPKCL